jgi:hypothetical protein
MKLLPSLVKWFKKPPAAAKPRKPAQKTPRGAFLQTQGTLYDLQEIYNRINQAYFENQLDLKITWFGSKERKARRHRKLGLYIFDDKVVKIHRLLDQAHFPPYFISYVVYHEMLHSVCPPVKARRGRYQIHHLEFKKKEMEFAEYALAKRWETENKRLFFAR